MAIMATTTSNSTRVKPALSVSEVVFVGFIVHVGRKPHSAHGSRWVISSRDRAFQQLYGSSQFDFGTEDRAWITSISFAVAPTFSDVGKLTLPVSISMSTFPGPAFQMSQDPTANRGNNYRLVFQGNVSFGPGPGASWTDIPLETPFLYDKSEGSLMFEYAGGSLPITDGTISLLRRQAAVFEVSQSRFLELAEGINHILHGGVVTTIGYTVVPEPEVFVILLLGGCILLSCRQRRQSLGRQPFSKAASCRD